MFRGEEKIQERIKREEECKKGKGQREREGGGQFWAFTKHMARLTALTQ